MSVQPAVSLADKYDATKPEVLLSGVQALVRMLIEQARRDRAVGTRTAGYVSGYRGSPLGGLDAELQAAHGSLEAAGIVFEPGLNEDLAATAILGTQQISGLGPTLVEGVFSLWYGKGPGVDRSGDPLKHGNLAGTDPRGGVLVVFGDDHPGKSSTVAHQSEQAISAHLIPVLYPASVEEVIDYGLLGWALSRYSGLWVGLKIVNETADTIATVDLSGLAASPVLPEPRSRPPEGVHFRGVFTPQRDEELVLRHKLPMARAFAAANGLDRLAVAAPQARLCIVTAGKAYADVMAALEILAAGGEGPQVRVYKIGMIWPLERDGLLKAVAGADEVFVVEEKKAFLEDQVARALVNLPSRPRLVGKTDELGAALLPSDAQLEPAALALAIGLRLQALSPGDAAVASRLEDVRRRLGSQPQVAPDTPARTPYFCSGCPHNTSTRTPDGALALSGIGCHTMAIWMDRNTLPPVQMGGEGANWIGAARFVERKHVFQNLGDGTYSHSGLLAIRAAANAGVNITYKILFNDAVAMTGGQAVEGSLTVARIARQVLAEGVAECAVVAEDPRALRDTLDGLPVRAHPRSDLDTVQRKLRETPGVTVLIYDQTCAAEKRRRRKRSEFPDPDRRLFINAAVCEGCGDCSVQSNCVSILPKETDLGRKREIDQSSCNKDYSCVEGFCPSFVSIEGAKLRRADWRNLVTAAAAPEPVRRVSAEGFAALVTGVGGTGVITVGAVLAMAARLEGLGALNHNMTGLAQKGGAVFSHLRIMPGPVHVARTPAKVGLGEADLVIGCDLVVTGGLGALAVVDRGRTVVVLNSAATPTAAFQRDRDFRLNTQVLLRNVAGSVADPAQVFVADAAAVAARVFGDSIAANMFLVGCAYQLGMIPLGAASIEQAVTLNRVAAEMNIAAFRLGRIAVHEPDRLTALMSTARQETAPEDESLDALVARRSELLRRYQDARYAARYRSVVARVREAEARSMPGAEALTRTVARNLAKLMAYKDEYEVARLYVDPAFRVALGATFEKTAKVTYHLAPPLLAPRNPRDGRPRKLPLGPWVGGVFEILARLKGLRGTSFDPFGYTAERRMERQLIAEYLADVDKALARLSPQRHAAALRLANWPEAVRGFGHVKAAAAAEALATRELLHAALEGEVPAAA